MSISVTRNGSRLLAITCMSALIAAAGELRSNDQPAAAVAAQGLTGKVLKLKGNFMPGPGPAPANRASTPLAVPVHIFKGRVAPFEEPNPKHPALVQIVGAGTDGVYRLALPPGAYTVVAEINGKLYLNLQISDGGKLYWCPVEVKPGQWTTFNIEDISEAAF